METKAYSDLFGLFLDGVLNVLSPWSILAFVSFWIVLYATFFKAKEEKGNASFFWVAFFSFCSILASGLGLFILGALDTSTQMNAYTLGAGVLLSLGAAALLYLEAPKKVKKHSYEDDDLPVSSFIPVLFGFAVAKISFWTWPTALAQQAKNVEMLGQAAFFGFVYVLAFVLALALIVFGVHKVIGAFIEERVQPFLGVVFAGGLGLAILVRFLL